MKRELTPVEKSAIRACISKHIEMLRKLRIGADVTEDLKDIFERSLFSPVCLISAQEDRETHPSHYCQVCAISDGAKHTDCLGEMQVLHAYQAAAETYLDSTLESAEVELSDAILRLIRAHWHILHARFSNKTPA